MYFWLQDHFNLSPDVNSEKLYFKTELINLKNKQNDNSKKISN